MKLLKHVSSLMMGAVIFAIAHNMNVQAASFLLDGQKLDLDRSEVEKLLVYPDRSESSPGSDIDDLPYIRIDDMLFPVYCYVDSNGEVDESAFYGRQWPLGNVYYIFDDNVTSLNRSRFRAAAQEWASAANLTFIEGMGVGNYIHVRDSSVNSSYVGMIGGRQYLNMYNWTWKFIIAHEIGHALGLVHEHQRNERDSYVNILFENIQPGAEHNFNIMVTSNHGDYDFYSVMHYGKSAFSISSGLNTIEPLPVYSQYLNIIGQREYLSVLDKEGMVTRYGEPNRLEVTPSNLDFGTIPEGTSLEKSVYIQNTGDGTISGTISASPPYGITSPTEYSLSGYQVQTVTILYNPSEAGDHDSTVSFSSGESLPVFGRCASNEDSDGDGLTDWEEYIAGTDPADRYDCFTVQSIQATEGGSVTLSFPTCQDRTYQGQSRTDLIVGDWTDAYSPVEGDGTVKHIHADSTGSSCNYYRVNVSLAP